jgi:hypothetical protein
MRPTILVPLAALALGACASSAGGSAPRTDAPSGRRDANLITAEEIAAQPAQTLYDVVRALRPAWMMRRRPTALMPQNEGQLLVYVDGTRFGSMESLRQLLPSSVQSIRYYSSSAAEAKFGTGHLQGAIEVTTKGH